MGTSKGYIPPTKPEWSNAKRAVSGFLRNRDSDSRANAIQKFGEAMIRAQRLEVPLLLVLLAMS